MQWKQVQKRTAKKLFDAGKNILFIPCKCNPYNDYRLLSIYYNKNMLQQDQSFDDVYYLYQIYNCTSETGTYIHFYIKC